VGFCGASKVCLLRCGLGWGVAKRTLFWKVGCSRFGSRRRRFDVGGVGSLWICGCRDWDGVGKRGHGRIGGWWGLGGAFGGGGCGRRGNTPRLIGR
jgi:hypothetical protein